MTLEEACKLIEMYIEIHERRYEETCSDYEQGFSDALALCQGLLENVMGTGTGSTVAK